MLDKKSVRTAPDNAVLKPGEQKLSPEELINFIENTRLAFYRSKDNYAAVINQFMGAVDMAQKIILLLQKECEEKDRKYAELAAELNKKKK